MSAFDPKAFLDLSMDAPMVRRPPIPEGDYTALLGEPETRPWVGVKDPTKSGVAVDIPVEVDVPQDIRERLNLTLPTIKTKYGFMLDLTPTGGIDMAPGMNRAIRNLRDALDLNKPGDSFRISMVAGRAIKVKIKHREYPEGSGEFFEDVAGVARA